MSTGSKKQGIIAGISLVIMAIVAGFSYGYVHNHLVTDSPVTTFQNLIANKSLFFASLFGWSTIFITDIIVSISLYYFFREIATRISLITSLIRLIYTLILGYAITRLSSIIPLLSSVTHPQDEEHAIDTFSFIQDFEKFWSLGLIVFGFHLIGLGYLSIKTKYVYNLIGYLLYLGGIGYILIHASRQFHFFTNHVVGDMENILTLPMALSEILLAISLIYYGFKKTNS